MTKSQQGPCMECVEGKTLPLSVQPYPGIIFVTMMICTLLFAIIAYVLYLDAFLILSVILMTSLLFGFRMLWMAYHNATGAYLWYIRDTRGHWHAHPTDPRIGKVHMPGKNTYLFGCDDEDQPFERDPKTLMLRVRVKGWFCSKGEWYEKDIPLDKHDSHGLKIDYAWGGRVRLEQMGVIFGNTDQQIRLGYLLEYMRRFRHPIDAVEMMDHTTILYRFLLDRIKETKEGLGKSKHAAVIRQFLENALENPLAYELSEMHQGKIQHPRLNAMWEKALKDNGCSFPEKEETEETLG